MIRRYYQDGAPGSQAEPTAHLSEDLDVDALLIMEQDRILMRRQDGAVTLYDWQMLRVGRAESGGLPIRSGLHPIQSRELTWDWKVSWDDLWVGLVAAMGQPYLTLDAPAQEQVRNQPRRRTRALEAEGHLRVYSVAAYVLARRTERH